MKNKSSIGEKLAYLSQSSNDQFDNPFQDTGSSIILDNHISSNLPSNKPKKKKDKFEKLLDDGKKLTSKFSEELITYFDHNLEGKMEEYENTRLKNDLISLGRKYTRETAVSAESSEIAKTFSGNEKILNNILNEIDKDKAELQKDIDNIRSMRTNRNHKTLCELVIAKGQFHNTSLSVIKELNGMKKTQIDLQMKVNKNNDDKDGDATSTNMAIQKLFTMGRGNILSPVGGYGAVSGAFEENIDDPSQVNSLQVSSGVVHNENDDEYVQKIYFNNNNDEKDGDKFLKYENMQVGYILLLDNDGNKNVIAEDMNGNIIPDYPMPSNLESLDFDISEVNKTASDNFHRHYKVRYI